MKSQGNVRFGLSRREILASVGAASVLSFSNAGFAANPTAPKADYVFSEGSAAQLAAVKRVIITDFVCAFQLDGSVRNDNATRVGNLTLRGGNANEVAASMVWRDPDVAVMQEIANAGLAALKADFEARGIEVLDESVLASQPAYASIIAAARLNDLGDYTILNITEDSAKGDIVNNVSNGMAKIVSAKGLIPYNHSVFEGGKCCYAYSNSFPSSKLYYVPGFEIDLAKALDAVVVKAWQFVNFTQVAAGVNQEGWAGGVGGAVVTFDATAKSVVRIREEKTRLSFRLPTSTNRTRNTPALVPPKDGDVVVSLGRPMLIGADYYSIENVGATGRQAVAASLGGVQHFNFGATLKSPDVYKVDVAQRMSAVLDGLVAAALGR